MSFCRRGGALEAESASLSLLESHGQFFGIFYVLFPSKKMEKSSALKAMELMGVRSVEEAMDRLF